MEGSLPLKMKWGKKSGRYDLNQDIYVLTVTVGEQPFIQCTLSTASTARQCIDYIGHKMILNQMEMFGLRYQMKTNDPDQRIFRWVEMEKPLRRQLERWACKPRQVQLAVLYHTPNAFTLTDQMARSFYFMMMKLDVVEGRLTAEVDKYISLAAYSLQVEYGPYDESVHDIEFMQSIPLIPKQTYRSQQILDDLLRRVQAVYAKLRDMPQAYAALLYIVDSIQSEGYGEEYFKAKDEDSSEVKVGYAPEGIVVRGGYGAPIKYRWSEIHEICGSKRQMQLKCKDGRVVEFTMEDTEMCRYVVMVLNWQFEYAVSKAIEQDNTPVDVNNLKGGFKTLKPINSSQSHLALTQSNPDIHGCRVGGGGDSLQSAPSLHDIAMSISSFGESPHSLNGGRQRVKPALSSVSFNHHQYPMSFRGSRNRAASTAAFSSPPHFKDQPGMTPTPQRDIRMADIRDALRFSTPRLMNGATAGSSSQATTASSEAEDNQEGTANYQLQPHLGQGNPPSSSSMCLAGPAWYPSPACASSQQRLASLRGGRSRAETHPQTAPAEKKMMGSSPEMRLLGTSSAASSSLSAWPSSSAFPPPDLSPLKSSSSILKNRSTVTIHCVNSASIPECPPPSLQLTAASSDIHIAPPYQSTPNLMQGTYQPNQRAFSDRQHNRVRSPEAKNIRAGLTASDQRFRIQMSSESRRGAVKSKREEEPRQPLADERTWEWLRERLSLPLDDLQAELTRIPTKRLSAGTSTSLKPENLIKNRTRAIVPYEDNRVTLRAHRQNPTGYINASNVQVNVGGKNLQFILTQAPLKESVDDFWQMVNEARVHVIVMLSEPRLDNSANSPIYWPLNASSRVDTRDVVVQFKGMTQTHSEVTTTLEMKCRESGERRMIYHLRYVGWPSGECPPDEEPLIAFMDSVRSVHRHVESERSRREENEVLFASRGRKGEASGGRSRSSSRKKLSDVSNRIRSASLERAPWKKRMNSSSSSSSGSPHSSHPPSLCSEPWSVDSGAPPSPSTGSASPLLIHCHTGSHESGVYLLVEVARLHIERNARLDIAALLGRLRAQRMCLVKNVDQYRFVLRLLATLLQQSRLI